MTNAQRSASREYVEYVVPGMTHDDGTVETITVHEGSAARIPYEILRRRSGIPEEGDPYEHNRIWNYLKCNYTDYKRLEQRFFHWGGDWDHCESCQALMDADEAAYGLDISCEDCEASMDERKAEAAEWVKAVELGIARWALRHWPELDIEMATDPDGYHDGIRASDVSAAPLVEYVADRE